MKNLIDPISTFTQNFVNHICDMYNGNPYGTTILVLFTFASMIAFLFRMFSSEYKFPWVSLLFLVFLILLLNFIPAGVPPVDLQIYLMYALPSLLLVFSSIIIAAVGVPDFKEVY